MRRRARTLEPDRPLVASDRRRRLWPRSGH